MIEAFPLVALIHCALAALVITISFSLYGTTTQLIAWCVLFPSVIAIRFVLDKALKPNIISRCMTKFNWFCLLSTRSLLGFVWSLGSIWFIQIDAQANLLSTTIWVTALAYAGTIFHINSIASLQTYFWSLMAPLSLYFFFVLNLHFEVFVITTAGIIYVSLYSKILHKRSIDRISDAIEKEQLIAELSKANKEITLLAEQDALTGLKNRTYFNQYIEQIWSQAIELNQNVCIILFDIDHFKAYNDNYGHVSGDRAIQTVANTLSLIELPSPTCFFARVGGEEFAAVLPNTDLISAIDIAEDIRFEVENSRLAHRYSSCSDVVTVSVGVAMTEPVKGDNIKDLIEQSDQALYRAKEGGRNIVATAKLHPHRVEPQAKLAETPSTH
ncbi:GGDEF domain-containing protein [Vibrio sp. RE86]|uniref:GGDEF domain-containing protein n=1 Tax=Vibrio sp. RE86 TaxID=2607605 RepID=UPI0020A2B82B|nr:GGDEF domain-containing protein [Vibrio sp. RE86]